MLAADSCRVKNDGTTDPHAPHSAIFIGNFSCESAAGSAIRVRRFFGNKIPWTDCPSTNWSGPVRPVLLRMLVIAAEPDRRNVSPCRQARDP